MIMVGLGLIDSNSDGELEIPQRQPSFPLFHEGWRQRICTSPPPQHLYSPPDRWVINWSIARLSDCHLQEKFSLLCRGFGSFFTRWEKPNQAFKFLPLVMMWIMVTMVMIMMIDEDNNIGLCCRSFDPPLVISARHHICQNVYTSRLWTNPILPKRA